MSGNAILIDDAIVHYVTLGRGRPVIFLHSWVGSWLYWFNAMQVASRRFRTYGLDLWGFGDTSHNAHHYSLEGQSTLLDNYLDELGIGKIAIVGHGLGALVGMKFALRYPQLVDRIMAVSCPLSAGALHSRLRTDSPTVLVSWLSDRSPETVTALEDASKADVHAITESIASLQGGHPFDQFRNLDISCLLLYGEKDRAIQLPDENIPIPDMMHKITLKQAGHFPMIEQQFPFEQLLMDFLGLESGASPKGIELK